MHRPAQRITRILACAAVVPAILVASGCSLLSGSDDNDGGSDGAGANPSSAPSSAGPAHQAAFSKLPDPCKTVTSGTLGDLVPEAHSGTLGKSEDTSLRGSCSWSSLDNNGVKGSQFRWLNVSLARFESDSTRGSGDKLAGDYYAKQIAAAKATEGATNAHTSPVADTGDQASAVRYDLKKKEGAFKQQTVIVRTKNVVVSIDFDGAGLAGEKTPDANALMQDAQRAAKETVNEVAAANGSGTPHGSSTPASHAPASHSSSAHHAKSSSSPSSSSPSSSPSPSSSSSASPSPSAKKASSTPKSS